MNSAGKCRPWLPDGAIEKPGQSHAAGHASRQDNSFENIPEDDDDQRQSDDSNESVHRFLRAVESK
jgi:hypothetical protein